MIMDSLSGVKLAKAIAEKILKINIFAKNMFNHWTPCKVDRETYRNL